MISALIILNSAGGTASLLSVLLLSWLVLAAVVALILPRHGCPPSRLADPSADCGDLPIDPEGSL